MPAKTALTLEQWLAKVLATIPGSLFKDIDRSVLLSHFKGMAAVFRAVEEDLYTHVNETFIMRCSEEFLEAHAAERLIPDIGYAVDARRRQVQEMRSRLHLDGIRRAVNDMLDDNRTLVEDGYSDGTVMLPADYNDDADNQVIDWDDLPNFFSVVIGPQLLPSHTFVSRSAYSDRDAYTSTVATGTSPVTDRVKAVIDTYKAAGTRYRIFQYSSLAFGFDGGPGLGGFDEGEFSS
jgi:hypothetical protein